MASQSGFILILVLMSSRDPGSVCLFWFTPDCLLHLELWQLLPPLAGSHPSALSICSKLRLSVSWVTISPPLGGSSSENIDTSHHYNFSWLPLLATFPPTGTLVWHAHWPSSRTELSNSRFPLQCVQQGKGLLSTQECSPTQWLAIWAWLWNCTPYLVDGWFLCLIPPAKWILYLAAPVKWFLYLTIMLKGCALLLLTCLVSTIWMGEFSFSGCFPESQIFKMKVI